MNRKVTHWLLQPKNQGEKEDEEHCCRLGHGVPKKTHKVGNGLRASDSNTTCLKKSTHRLMVMKSKLQLESPISRAVAKADKADKQGCCGSLALHWGGGSFPPSYKLVS